MAATDATEFDRRVLCLAARHPAVAAVVGAALACWPSRARRSTSSGSATRCPPASFAAAQVWFGIHHLGLLAGLLALRWAERSRTRGRPAGAVAAAVVGMAGLTVTELVAIAAADADVDSGSARCSAACTASRAPRWAWPDRGRGLGARAQTWTAGGVGRAGLGVWVFVPMFPALVVTPTDGARLAIGGWMLLFAALGALLSPVRRAVRLPLRSARTRAPHRGRREPSGPSAWMRNR